MSFEITTCATVYCDRCLTLATDSRGSAQHWLDRAAAVEQLLQLGWQVNSAEDRAVCPTCVLILVCLNTGHDWGPWQELLPLDISAAAVRTCRRCSSPQTQIHSAARAQMCDPA